MNYQILDHLLAIKNHSVQRDIESKAWVWVERLPNGDDLVVHGAQPGYTMAEAYEDALRDCLGITPLADEVRR